MAKKYQIQPLKSKRLHKQISFQLTKKNLKKNSIIFFEKYAITAKIHQAIKFLTGSFRAKGDQSCTNIIVVF